MLNDAHGHPAGDLLLQRVSERLVSCLQEGNQVARSGGDEFVVILENLSVVFIEAIEKIKDVYNQITPFLINLTNLLEQIPLHHQYWSDAI